MNGFGTTSEQGLLLEDLLPVHWRGSDSEISHLDVAKFDGKNEEVLRFIEVLEEFPNEFGGEHSPLNQELLRVEIKFDLLLSLVSQLLGVYFPLPAPVRVRLTPIGIQWTSNEAVGLGSLGFVEIYLSTRCPRPLTFPARVENIEKDEQQGYRVSALFKELSGPVRERLEKMIFRHHRRGVALARRRVIPDPKTPP
jgi:Atypical PilZ domain, cyclic di-GMP receptor